MFCLSFGGNKNWKSVISQFMIHKFDVFCICLYAKQELCIYYIHIYTYIYIWLFPNVPFVGLLNQYATPRNIAFEYVMSMTNVLKFRTYPR